MTERLLIAGAAFLYVMAILEACMKSHDLADRVVVAIYAVLAFGLSLAWAVLL